MNSDTPNPESATPRPLTPEMFSQEAEPSSAPVDYYDSQRSRFLVKNSSGRWLQHDLTSYRRILRSRGLSQTPGEGEMISQIDLAILEVQNFRDINYAGPICGRNSGPIEANGKRVLVTEDMRLIEPVEGEFSNLMTILSGLFVSGEDPEIGRAQFHSFLGWSQSSVHSLRSGVSQQQQVLAICGPAGCGKSLLQHLMTEMLGGRGAKANRYFSGKTDFNGDLFGAEHLMLEDDVASFRTTDRLRIAARLKEHTVGCTVASLHPKNRDAINLPAWWRVSITANDNPEAMAIIPPLDDHFADKIILLRASKFKFPMPVSNQDERRKFRGQLSAEIPAFLHWLLHEYKIPDEFRDDRYNIATFHHPELKTCLEALSPEADLLDLIDAVFGEQFKFHDQLRLKADQIEHCLLAHNTRRAEKLLKFRNACGTYLGRLARSRPDRVTGNRSSTDRFWIISAPSRPWTSNRPKQ